MSLGMPSGGGGGGYQANDTGGSGMSWGQVSGGGGGPQLSGQQQALLNYTQGAMGMNQGNYNAALGAIGAQRNAINGAYGSAAGAANRSYGLDIRGINQDLMYGNQLRTQEQYRNVDLARLRSGQQLWGADRGWGIQQGDINRRVGFAGRGFGLANQGTQAQYGTAMRGVASDSIARGARTAAGTLSQFGDVAGARTRGLAENRLGYDSTLSGLRTERQQGQLSNTMAHKSYGLDQRTFDSLAKTYGIQFAQAAADASLAKDRAGANRSAATGNAGAGRASALAGLAGSQQSAYSNYMQQQMSLYSQLLGS